MTGIGTSLSLSFSRSAVRYGIRKKSNVATLPASRPVRWTRNRAASHDEQGETSFRALAARAHKPTRTRTQTCVPHPNIPPPPRILSSSWKRVSRFLSPRLERCCVSGIPFTSLSLSSTWRSRRRNPPYWQVHGSRRYSLAALSVARLLSTLALPGAGLLRS